MCRLCLTTTEANTDGCSRDKKKVSLSCTFTKGNEPELHSRIMCEPELHTFSKFYAKINIINVLTKNKPKKNTTKWRFLLRL